MLAPKSVAEFYADLFVVLGELDLKLHINTMPCEIADGVPFDQDLTHASYDRDYANRFWDCASGLPPSPVARIVMGP